MVPYAAAGPLSGTVAPIRMLLAVTPGSLLVWLFPPEAGAGAALVAAGAELLLLGAGAPPPAEQAASARLTAAANTTRTIGCFTIENSSLCVDLHRTWRDCTL